MKNNLVSVFLWGREICRLEWLGGYKQHFGKLGAKISFHPDYAETGWNLDPLGPYTTDYYFVRKGLSDYCRATEYEGLPRFMSGVLPDVWGNKVFSAWVQSRNLRHSDINSVDKLAFIGNRGMGALEFVPQMYHPGEAERIALDELFSLAREIELARSEISLDLKNNPGINDLMSVGMSAGGQHPKAIIAIDRTTGEIRSGQILLPENFTQYLLKFRDSDNWPGPELEYIYSKMASLAGIQMERCELLDIGGQKHFLTERFDRKKGEKQYTATLQALCGPVSSYEDIFKAFRKLKLPATDREQLYRRAVFNYLACVCDDHDKNFSLIMSRDGNWHLSPAYDETFTVNLVNRFIDDKHAMVLTGSDRRVSEAQLLKLAEENDIQRAPLIITEVLNAVKEFRSLAEEAGLEHPVMEIVASYLKMQSDALH